MDPKILTESGWKTAAAKFKIKSNELQKALAEYDKTEDEEHDDLLEGIAEIRKHALALKKSREAAAAPAALKYLAELLVALEAEQRDVAKARTEADKANADDKKHAPQAKADEGEEPEEDEDEEDEEYEKALLTAFQKLKGAKDVTFEFIVCDAKPHCAVMVAKKIGAKHKTTLSEVAGSKRFLHTGVCRMENGKFRFEMEKPVAGLAKKLQDAIKHHTGKKLPILVGNESADDEGERVAAPIPRLTKAELSKAPEIWHGTRDLLENNISALKTAVRKQCASEADEFIDQINGSLERMSRVLERLDARLADSLSKAHGVDDPSGRRSELQKAKAILAEYINYVKAEPLIAHIDSNPFGVKTNLKAILSGSLTHMAQAMA